IEVAGDGTHGGKRGEIIRIMGPKRRIESERGVALAGTWRRSDRDKVSPGIDIDEIVRETVGIEIGKRGGGPEGGNPGRDAFEAGMHLANKLVGRMIGS